MTDYREKVLSAAKAVFADSDLDPELSRYDRQVRLLAEFADDALRAEPFPAEHSGDVWSELIERETDDAVRLEMMKRRAFGLYKYGTPLGRDDGRNHARDALDEALDLLVYLRAMGKPGPDHSTDLEEAARAIVLALLRRLNHSGFYYARIKRDGHPNGRLVVCIDRPTAVKLATSDKGLCEVVALYDDGSTGPVESVTANFVEPVSIDATLPYVRVVQMPSLEYAIKRAGGGYWSIREWSARPSRAYLFDSEYKAALCLRKLASDGLVRLNEFSADWEHLKTLEERLAHNGLKQRCVIRGGVVEFDEVAK